VLALNESYSSNYSGYSYREMYQTQAGSEIIDRKNGKKRPAHGHQGADQELKNFNCQSSILVRPAGFL
jgi:hypothetical protein